MQKYYSVVRRAIKHGLLESLSLEVNKLVSESMLKPVNHSLRDRGLKEIACILTDSINDGIVEKNMSVNDVYLIVKEFNDNVIGNSPFKQADGGSQYNAALVLYTLCKVIQPAIVVESGVFKGFSTWIIREALPDASIYCFDISFSLLKYKDIRAQYYEHDLLEFDFGKLNLENSLIFFDDHVSHLKRIQDASRIGISKILFDDAYSATQIQMDGVPPLPTTELIYDSTLKNGVEYSWVTRGGVKSYIHDTKECLEVKKLIFLYKKLPSLTEVFGYKASNLAYMELKS